jgi:large subunit ribosomal protein L17
MRHNAAGRKLGRRTGHRLAMFRNQLASLVASERIVTTVAKAKELRPLAERMVTQGKRGTLHARRMVGRWVPDRMLIKKLFDEIAPRFASRAGGYLRIVKLGSRHGDGAEMAVLEFVDFQLKAKPQPAPVAAGRKGKKSRQPGGAPAEGAPPVAETAPPERKGKAAKVQPASHKAPTKTAPKGKAKPVAKAPTAAKKTSTPKKIGSS